MNNTILITGASTGIGKELAYLHAQKGGDVVLIARRQEKLKQIKEDLEKQYNITAKVIVKDLTQPNAPQEIYDEITKEGIIIDYLINNAGFGGHGKFYERKWEDDLAMIHLNIVALTALTRMFLSDFVKRNAGKILNVSSTASLLPGPLQAVYFATKAYVTSFSNALAEELCDTDVTVTALLPGATETEFAKVSGMDQTELFQDTFSAREVAQDGYQGMMIGKLNVLTGLTLIQKLRLVLIPFIPKKVIMKQIRKMQESKN